jgi:hypothetical protein
MHKTASCIRVHLLHDLRRTFLALKLMRAKRAELSLAVNYQEMDSGFWSPDSGFLDKVTPADLRGNAHFL